MLDGIQTEEISTGASGAWEKHLVVVSMCAYRIHSARGGLLTGVTSQPDAKPVFKRQIQFRVEALIHFEENDRKLELDSFIFFF